MATLLEKAANGVPDQHGIVHNQCHKRCFALNRQSIPRVTLTKCYCASKIKGQRRVTFVTRPSRVPNSFFLRELGFFDGHISEFAGFEDFAAF